MAFISLWQKRPQARDENYSLWLCINLGFCRAECSLTPSLPVYVCPTMAFSTQIQILWFYLLWCQLLIFTLPSLLISFGNTSVCLPCWSSYIPHVLLTLSNKPHVITKSAPLKAQVGSGTKKPILLFCPLPINLRPLIPTSVSCLHSFCHFFFCIKPQNGDPVPSPCLFLGSWVRFFTHTYSICLPILPCSPQYLEESYLLLWKLYLLTHRKDLKEKINPIFKNSERIILLKWLPKWTTSCQVYKNVYLNNYKSSDLIWFF